MNPNPYMQYGGANPFLQRSSDFQVHVAEASKSDFQPSQTNTPQAPPGADFSNIHYMSHQGAPDGSYVAFDEIDELLGKNDLRLKKWKQLLKGYFPFFTGLPYPTMESISRCKFWSPIHWIMFLFTLITLTVVLCGSLGTTFYLAFIRLIFDPVVPFEFVSVGIDARGFIALGIYARGVIALGVFATGPIAIGTMAVGIISCGCLNIGLLVAFGCFCAGLGYCSGVMCLGGYVHNAILGFAVWDAEGVILATRIIRPFVEWYSYFPEEREHIKRQNDRMRDLIRQKREKGQAVDSKSLCKDWDVFVYAKNRRR